MNYSAAFIRRPVATSLFMLSILLLGLAGFRLLPIAALPQADLPTIQVSAALPGASAEVMATSIVAPLERKLSLVPGATDMTSSSSLGQASITIQFDLDRNIDAAAQDVQAAINAAAGQLPKTMPSPPTYEKANPADFQIMSLAVTSDVMSLPELDYYADSYIAQQLSRIKGVGLIDLHGEQKPAVRVQVNPTQIANLGLSLEDIRAALGVSTTNTPKGTLDGPQKSLTLNTTDQLTKASGYEDLVIAYKNGAPIRVRDIGRALDDVEDVKQAGWLQDRRAIIIDIHKLPGFNVADTVDAIKAQLPALTKALPPTVTVDVVGDRTQTIRASVNDIEFTLLLSVFLVVLVVFAFLRSFWATVIAGVAIPVSIIGTFGVMYLLGYSVNNVSLMGMTIAVGFVVDDAIVMIENISRYLEEGESPLEAALRGSSQVFFTIISMTVSLIAALIPLLFMGGIVGRLFREFSVTISVSLILSGIVSLTLTPMMCRVLLKPTSRRQPNRWYRTSERAFDWMLAKYTLGLDWALANGLMMLGITAITLAVTVGLYWVAPKGLFPQQDTGLIMGTTEAAPDISAPAMADLQLSIVKKVMSDPDVDNVYSWIGPNPTVNNGRLMINLKPFSQRKASAQQIIDRLRSKTAGIEHIALFMQARQDLTAGARSSKSQFQYTLADADLAELLEWAPRLTAKLSTLPQLSGVTSDLQASVPQVTVVINRDAAARFGISPQLIDDTLYDAFGQRQVATIFTQLNQNKVVLEVDPDRKLDASALAGVYLPSSTGHMVPLSVVSRLETGTAPLQINHQGQFPAITVSFNLGSGAALGDAVSGVEAAVRALGMPTTVHGTFQGTAQAFKASLASQPYLIAAAIVAVYIILGILYESYVHPITILSTLPAAGLGALLALLLFHYELSFIAVVGIILLIGIVKKNAIMMIDFALEAQREGLSPAAAIRQASLLRFRPILMTTAAAIFAGLPLALGTGAGSELRAPLGIAIVGGLIVSQILTLFTTPIIYLYLDRESARVRRLFSARSQAERHSG